MNSNKKIKKSPKDDFVVFRGICYPSMQKKNPSNAKLPLQKIQNLMESKKMSESERQSLIKDPVVMLKLEEYKKLDEYPIYNDHNFEVGSILYTKLTRDKRMQVVGIVNDKTTMEDMRSGKLKELSIGYDKMFDNQGNTKDIEYKEISVTEKGVHDGCSLEVIASERGKRSVDEDDIFWATLPMPSKSKNHSVKKGQEKTRKKRSSSTTSSLKQHERRTKKKKEEEEEEKHQNSSQEGSEDENTTSSSETEEQDNKSSKYRSVLKKISSKALDYRQKNTELKKKYDEMQSKLNQAQIKKANKKYEELVANGTVKKGERDIKNLLQKAYIDESQGKPLRKLLEGMSKKRKRPTTDDGSNSDEKSGSKKKKHKSKQQSEESEIHRIMKKYAGDKKKRKKKEQESSSSGESDDDDDGSDKDDNENSGTNEDSSEETNSKDEQLSSSREGKGNYWKGSVNASSRKEISNRVENSDTLGNMTLFELLASKK